MDQEARVHGSASAEHPQTLRLWLRLLTCTQLIERQVRSRLREQFGTTLPRFDLMAQLERAPHGLKMNELSRRMMVTSGNVTGVAKELVAQGLVRRAPVPGDRRVCQIRLTPKGRRQFASMARQHDAWIADAFAALPDREVAALHQLLGTVKQGILAAPDRARSID